MKNIFLSPNGVADGMVDVPTGVKSILVQLWYQYLIFDS